jgi:hypothetical protein
MESAYVWAKEHGVLHIAAFQNVPDEPRPVLLDHLTVKGLMSLLSQSGPAYRKVIVPTAGMSPYPLGIVSAIEREDGSGKSFNVTVVMDKTQEPRTVYVRCRS